MWGCARSTTRGRRRSACRRPRLCASASVAARGATWCTSSWSMRTSATPRHCGCWRANTASKSTSASRPTRSGRPKTSAKQCSWPTPTPATTSSRRCTTRQRASRWAWPISVRGASGTTRYASSSSATAPRATTTSPARPRPKATRATCWSRRACASPTTTDA